MYYLQRQMIGWVITSYNHGRNYLSCHWPQSWSTYAPNCIVHALGIVDLYILSDAYERWFAEHNLSINFY